MTLYNRCSDQWQEGLRIASVDILAEMEMAGIDPADRPRLADEVKAIIAVIAREIQAERERQRELDGNGNSQDRSGSRR